MLNKLRWKMYIVWLSFKWVRNVNLGDLVWYQGKKYSVSNGVMSNSWRLFDIRTGNTETANDGWVPRSECKKVKSISNYIGSFKSGYRFYMGYWYDIWIREGIIDWMRGCNIWPK